MSTTTQTLTSSTSTVVAEDVHIRFEERGEICRGPEGLYLISGPWYERLLTPLEEDAA